MPNGHQDCARPVRPAGLFSVGYDVAERQLRGILPQAFVHALLLRAAGGAGPANLGNEAAPPG